MIAIDQYTRTGRRVIDMRRPVGSGGTGGGVIREWKVSRTVTVEGETETATLTVSPGLRAVIGGIQTEEPSEHVVELTEDQSASGVWVVKEFSNVVNGWISGVQVIPLDDPDLVPVADSVIQDEQRGSEYIEVAADSELADGELLEVEYRLFPSNMKRQYRVLAHVSAEGAVTQYAYGTIYAVGDPEKVERVEDTPENEVEEEEDEAECDQNDHPGDDEYDTGAGGGEDDDEDDEHPGDGDTGDEDDTDHPGAEDCYTTR